MPIFKNIGQNNLGRDFIVGDLHGFYEELMRLLSYVDFDKTRDRLISVGDLIDRGPSSLECLNLVLDDNSWFHCVLGNHEEMMVSTLSGDWTWYKTWVKNGGEWFDALKSEEQLRISGQLSKLKNLPIMISGIDFSGKPYTVVHSEITNIDTMFGVAQPQNIDFTLTGENLAKKIELVQVQEGRSILWGRCYFKPMSGAYIFPKDHDKIEHHLRSKGFVDVHSKIDGIVYGGHTIINKPIMISIDGKPKMVNLDTGPVHQEEADFDFGLTITEAGTNIFFTAKNGKVGESFAEVINL